jgi:hypothetical protein
MFGPSIRVYIRTCDAPDFNLMSMGQYVSLVPMQSVFRDARKYAPICPLFVGRCVHAISRRQMRVCIMSIPRLPFFLTG